MCCGVPTPEGASGETASQPPFSTLTSLSASNCSIYWGSPWGFLWITSFTVLKILEITANPTFLFSTECFRVTLLVNTGARRKTRTFRFTDHSSSPYLSCCSQDWCGGWKPTPLPAESAARAYMERKIVSAVTPGDSNLFPPLNKWSCGGTYL